MQNVEQTILSQYAQAPSINALIGAFNQWIDPSSKIDQFFTDIWNIDTATGYGLDVWGRIVGVGRVLQVDLVGGFFGFNEATNISANPFNSAPFYSGQQINSNFILNDDGFRVPFADTVSGSRPAAYLSGTAGADNSAFLFRATNRAILPVLWRNPHTSTGI